MEHTAKNFALQLGALVSLYISIGALIALLLNVITAIYPDAAAGIYEHDAAVTGIRFAISMLIVFFPTYIILTRIVNVIRRHEQGTYLTLTKWLIYLSLLIGGGVLLGDLVAVLNEFMNGELTVRFVLKALTVLIVVGSAFTYYLADVRGYWQSHEVYSIRYAMATAVFVVSSLALGFANIETPSEVREVRIDQAQIGDLTLIQSQIEQYVLIHNSLPLTFEDAFQGAEIPTAPEGRAAYAYEVIGVSRFKLCAEFLNATSKSELTSFTTPIAMDVEGIKNPYDWDHGAGVWCFERVLGSKTMK